MERLSAEGFFFHRSCFQCFHCRGTLRLAAYAFDQHSGECLSIVITNLKHRITSYTKMSHTHTVMMEMTQWEVLWFSVVSCHTLKEVLCCLWSGRFFCDQHCSAGKRATITSSHGTSTVRKLQSQCCNVAPVAIFYAFTTPHSRGVYSAAPLILGIALYLFYVYLLDAGLISLLEFNKSSRDLICDAICDQSEWVRLFFSQASLVSAEQRRPSGAFTSPAVLSVLSPHWACSWNWNQCGL